MLLSTMVWTKQPEASPEAVDQYVQTETKQTWSTSINVSTPIDALYKMSSLSIMFPSKKEEESGLSSYYNNKTTIIQEARVFNDSPISPRKCRALLTRIVYLLYIGETFGTQEATTLFFGTTKLFQHKDVSRATCDGIRCINECVM